MGTNAREGNTGREDWEDQIEGGGIRPRFKVQRSRFARPPLDPIDLEMCQQANKKRLFLPFFFLVSCWLFLVQDM